MMDQVVQPRLIAISDKSFWKYKSFHNGKLKTSHVWPIILGTMFDWQIHRRMKVSHCLYLQYGDRDGDRGLSVLKDNRTSTSNEVLSGVSESTLYLGQVLQGTSYNLIGDIHRSYTQTFRYNIQVNFTQQMETEITKRQHINLVNIVAFILSPLTWGSKLSIDIDVYSSVLFLCVHLQGWWGYGKQPIGLITGVHSEHRLTALSIQGSMACHRNTCVDVRGKLICSRRFLQKISCRIINHKDTKSRCITKGLYVGQGHFVFIFVFWCGIIEKLQDYGVV